MRSATYSNADKDTLSGNGISLKVSPELLAARKAAKAYQTCLLAGFALPVLGVLAFAFLY